MLLSLGLLSGIFQDPLGLYLFRLSGLAFRALFNIRSPGVTFKEGIIV